MPPLFPRITAEPPPEYVAFVARHLEPLRRDAALVVGGEHDADLLYLDALTEVATRWTWLELLRTRLGRPGAADLSLDRAFARQSQRWMLGPAGPDQFDIEVRTWYPEDYAPPPRPRYVSNAVRLAPLIAPPVRAAARYLTAAPVCEAAIAWWHAYEVRRRRRILAVVVAGIALLALLARCSAPSA